MADAAVSREALMAARLDAKELVATGLGGDVLIAELVRAGHSNDAARLAQRYLGFEVAVRQQRHSRSHLYFGFVPAVLGVMLFLCSYTWLPLSTGLAGGLIAWGLWNIVVGALSHTKVVSSDLNTIDLPYPTALLFTAEERIAEARRSNAAFGSARFWSMAFGLGSGAVVFVIGILGTANWDDWFIFVALAAVVSSLVGMFGASRLIYRAESLDPPTLAQAFEQRATQPATSYAVPMGPRPSTLSERDIIAANINPGFPVLGVTGGIVGKPAVDGVIFATVEGFVFLPELERDDFLSVSTAMNAARTIAVQFVPLLGEVQARLEEMSDKLPPTQYAVLLRALSHPAHFVIHWHRLVKTTYDRNTFQATLTRGSDSGSEEAFAIKTNLVDIAEALMLLRLQSELDRALADVATPLNLKHVAELTPKYRDIYGDRLGEHEQELIREAIDRTHRHRMANLQNHFGTAREAIAPMLPMFEGIPGIKEKFPWLFSDTLEQFEQPIQHN